jgi:hypothetical protein
MISIALAGLYVFGATFLVASIATFDALDRLIEHEYESHRDAWERDGRPSGVLFHPPEAKFFRSSLAFQRCALIWPFSAPLWTRDDTRAASLLTRLRRLFFTSNAALLLSIVCLCLYLQLTVAI